MENKFLDTLKTCQRVTGHKKQTIKEVMTIFNELGDEVPDFYGNGEVINNFEEIIATELGTDGSVFYPSGTMAQQIALRIWCDRNELLKVAYHPLSHLEIYEQDGLKVLHNIETILLGEKNRLFTIEDLKKLDQVSVVLFELPQREIGGQLPEWNDLVGMIKYCKERGFKTHLDGARLFECLPYYDKTAKEVVDLFDSAYISFYKGFGGITGAILAGSNDFLTESKIWKRRHGGDLYQLFPYIVSAQKKFELRKDRMKDYYQNAVKYAKMLNTIKGFKTIPEIPVSNMFHLYIDGDMLEITSQLVTTMEETNLGLIPSLRQNESGNFCEISIGDMFNEIGEKHIQKAIEVLKELRK